MEDIEKEKGAKDKVIGIHPINLMLSWQIMSFLKGLPGLGMIPPIQTHTNPTISKIVPMWSEVGGNDAFCHFFWVR